MILEEEGPSGENINGSVITDDDKVILVDTAVSSTAVSPEPTPIPAPVRASVCNQQAVKGRGTKDHPYKLDFAPTICGSFVLACSK